MAFDRAEITRAIRAAGTEISPEAMRAAALYTAFHETEPYRDVTVERDIHYGPDERNRLDVFSGKPGADRDVLVFIHGGGFVGGDKKVPNSPYHDNVALWAVRNGMVGINMTYRLAPKHAWPSGIEDIAGVVEWIGKNIRARGGNPDRIFLLAASAGAMHAGSYITHGRLAGGQPIAGAILQSGIYDYTKELIGQEINERAGSYLGTDQVKLKERSSLKGIVETKTPVLFALCEFDPDHFEAAHLLLLNTYVKTHGRWPNFTRLLGHNHLSPTNSLNTPDDYFAKQMLAFIDTVPRS